ncbi:MAG: hypothetical protein IJR54_09150 [Oscillibacter sp.]|nr:hypothetical protein [Oscillibacter sp.]
MKPDFDFLSVSFFTKAEIYPGSIGSFRYRFQRFSWPGKEDAHIQAWVYENICFEQARNIETKNFAWTPEGVQELRAWLETKLQERGAPPYRVPYSGTNHALT